GAARRRRAPGRGRAHLPRGRRQQPADRPEPRAEPGQRGRLRPLPEPAGLPRRVRLLVAAAASLALRQGLEGPRAGGPVGRRAAVRLRPAPRARDDRAVVAAGGPRRGAALPPPRRPRAPRLRERLPERARGAAGAAGRAARRRRERRPRRERAGALRSDGGARVTAPGEAGAPSTPGRVRRVVTGVGEDGRSRILSDRLLPTGREPDGSFLRIGLWVTDASPASNQGTADPVPDGMIDQVVPPSPGGTVVRIVDIPPEAAW